MHDTVTIGRSGMIGKKRCLMNSWAQIVISWSLFVYDTPFFKMT